MKIGYAQDITGNTTERLEILAETTDGRCVVRHFTMMQDLFGKPYITVDSLQLRKKEDIKEVREQNDTNNNRNG